MTTKYEDDTTGEQYTPLELKKEGIIGGDPRLFEAGVAMDGGMLFDSIDFHPEHADYDELRERLHEMVDAAVDSYEDRPEAGDE